MISLEEACKDPWFNYDRWAYQWCRYMSSESKKRKRMQRILKKVYRK